MISPNFFRCSALLAMMAAFLAVLEAGVRVEYSLVQGPGSQWSATYCLVNTGSETVPVDSLTLSFERSRYEAVTATGSPAGYDALVLDAEPLLDADASLDFEAQGMVLTPGARLEGFAASFDYHGPGRPGPQYFEIADPDGYALLATGQTTPKLNFHASSAIIAETGAIEAPDASFGLNTGFGALVRANADFLVVVDTHFNPRIVESGDPPEEKTVFDTTYYIYSTTTGELLDRIVDPRNPTNLVLEGNQLAAGIPTDADRLTESDRHQVLLWSLGPAGAGEPLVVEPPASEVDLNDGSRFGAATAISGIYGLVANPADEELADAATGRDFGAVYVFDQTNPEAPPLKLQPADRAPGDRFGTSLATQGDVALIGSPGSGDNEEGALYLFFIPTGQELLRLSANDALPGDRFGSAVVVNDDYVLVTASGRDESGEDVGAVYAFAVADGEQLHKLTASDGTSFDDFGASLALAGDLALVGCPGDDDAGVDSGAVYIYDLLTGRELGKFLARDGRALDRLGTSLAVDGATALVGSPSPGGSGGGHLYRFTLPDFENDQDRDRLNDFWEEQIVAAAAGDALDAIDAVLPEDDYDLDGFLNAAESDLFFVPVQSDSPAEQTELLKIVPFGALPAAGAGGFGQAVALQGAIAAIGSAGDNDFGVPGSGSVTVVDAMQPYRARRIVPAFGRFPTAPGIDERATVGAFGRAVAIRGNLMAVGSPGNTGSPSDGGIALGAIHLFDRDSGEEVQRLYPTGPTLGQGAALALAPPFLVAGRAAGQAGEASFNHVEVFALASGNSVYTLSANEVSLPAEGSRFGSTLAAEAGILVVGDPGDGGGAVHLFDLATGAILDMLTGSTPDEEFGSAVAAGEGVVLIGSPAALAAGGVRSGLVWVVDLATREVLRSLEPELPVADQHFGEAVAINGTLALVGSPADPVDGQAGAGSAFLFNWTTGQQLARFSASDAEAADRFGSSVSLGASLALVGSPQEDDAGPDAGAAYLFLTKAIGTGSPEASITQGSDGLFLIDFVGRLEQSSDLQNWQAFDPPVRSPFQISDQDTPRRFFRAASN